LFAGNSPQTVSNPSIHILDDDSLLEIFYLYRPPIFDGDEHNNLRVSGGNNWKRERWWYKLAQVCQRWRNLILGSPSYLGLSLVCTYGTPIADMLSHSPPLPLDIDFFRDHWDITAEGEEGVILALEQYHRIRRVRFLMPIPKLQKFINITMAINEEYPVLEYLIMAPPMGNPSSALMLPETFQAPHLRHLSLRGFVLPTESRLLTTSVGLVMLCLHMEHPSAYFQPNILLQWISLMPQLEMLLIAFFFPVPNHDVMRQLMHTRITTHATLPNLRRFEFQGVSAYMEAVIRRITTPRLEKLRIQFFNQLTFSVPCHLQFMNTTENIRFNRAVLQFLTGKVFVWMVSDEDEMCSHHIKVPCWHLDWQVSSMAQIVNSPSQIFSMVEHLNLEHEVHSLSSEEHNEVDRSEWRKLLRPFCNVKSLQVDNGLVKELSRSLRLDDGEHPLELLPELQELTCSGSEDSGDAFMAFIDARRNAGRPVTLFRRRPRSIASFSSASASGKDGDPLPESIRRETCPICIADLEDSDDVCVLPCKGNHVFHQACVDDWPFELPIPCPICRHGTSSLIFATRACVDTDADGVFVFVFCRLPDAEDDTYWWRAHRAALIAVQYLRFARRRHRHRMKEVDLTPDFL
jgi:Ring finger domain